MEIKNNQFYLNNQPSFYLADTCWSAFTNIQISDWNYYLDYRKSQGFNVIQVNMLWQWDASKSLIDSQPFHVNEDGTFDFNRRNETYFDRAYEMIRMAKEKDITIALVLLWVNYLPDTWATKLKKTSLFPKELIEDYVEYVMDRYNEFEPIYIISGDTDFPTEEVTEMYQIAMDKVKQIDEKATTTLHIRGRQKEIPDALKNSDNLDFYMFQSGHNKDYQYMAYELAEDFYNKEPKRPSINSEPCYELMGYSRKAYGRFSREDVRRAAWQSVLSGAQYGVTYGAHGIWSWHTEGLTFDSEVGEAFESPYDWHDALHFEGAWDYSFIKYFIEENKLFDLVPTQNLLKNKTSEIRIAENNKKIVIYIPSNITIKLNGNYSNLTAKYIDLESKNESSAVVTYKNTYTEVSMHRFTRDALLVIDKL